MMFKYYLIITQYGFTDKNGDYNYIGIVLKRNSNNIRFKFNYKCKLVS